MKILGIDYGRKKVGLAIADGPLAAPYGVIRYKDTEFLCGKIQKIIKENSIEKVVVGMSEGEMEVETKKFVDTISHKLLLAIKTIDETLSTHDAQALAIQAGIGRKKRKELEDAFAATIVLQSYLDKHV